MPGYDHPNGGTYETQEERMGSGRFNSRSPNISNKPKVKIEQTFTFEEEQIKEILSAYVQDNYDVVPTKVDADYREEKFYTQLDHDPGYCRFIVKAIR